MKNIQRKEIDDLKKIRTLGIVLCIMAGMCSYQICSNCFTKKEAVNIIMNEEEINIAFEQFKGSINADLSLDQILDEFKAICEIPACDSMVLYETGRYAFHLEPLFHIMLMRQYHDMDGKEKKLCVDLQYEPDLANTDLRECVWSDEIQEDIFEYIKVSDAYQYALEVGYSKVDVYLNEGRFLSE